MEKLDKENKAISGAKKQGLKYKPRQFSNGDTPKQLSARSRYIIVKKPHQWTDNQKRELSCYLNYILNLK